MNLQNAQIGVGWVFLCDGFHEYLLCRERKFFIIIFFTRSEVLQNLPHDPYRTPCIFYLISVYWNYLLLPAGGSNPQQNPTTATTGHNGWVQLGLGFEESNLIVTLWAADGLKMVENMESLALPKPYAIVRLCMYG